MAAYISSKKSWIRLLLSLCAAGGSAVLLNILLAGPLLGPWYDFLMKYRAEPPVSREILLIESGNSGPALQDAVVEPPALASLLITMVEMEAAALVIQAPVLDLSKGNSEDGGELLHQLDEEFSLLGRNIRNLFNAIRAGSIAPLESGRYVGELVDLTERGKERLVAILMNRDGMSRFERAAAAFGQAWQTGYYTIQPDWDGRFRRIAPVLEDGTNHIIYSLFRARRGNFGLEDTEEGPVLRNTARGGGERLIPLDRKGALLIEMPRRGETFRRISLDSFLEYEKEDRTLRQLLGEAEGRGIYNALEPEDYPPLRYDYALALREDMLEEPEPAKKIRWIEARNAYFQGLEDLLYGPEETRLVTGYEELAASGELDEAGILRITALRDELIALFAGLRDRYRRVLTLREDLAGTLSASLCILGPTLRVPGEGEAPARRNPGDAGASALFANALLNGALIVPGSFRYGLLFSLGPALFCLLCIRRRGPLLSLALGVSLCALTLAGFSYSFIRTAYWIDPLIPGGTMTAAVLVSTLCALLMKRRFGRYLRTAYGPFIPKRRLRDLIRGGKPLPGETVLSRAAIVAVRNSALMSREDREPPLAAAAEVEAFRKAVAGVFREAGGTIVGSAGDLVLGAFGSPLEEPPRGAGKNRGVPGDPALRAAEMAARLRGRRDIPGHDAWRFGIDAGECAFTWSALSGYCAFGHPVVRARILAGLASRYRARALISRTAGEGLEGLELRKLDILGEQDGTGRETFYELLGISEGPTVC